MGLLQDIYLNGKFLHSDELDYDSYLYDSYNNIKKSLESLIPEDSEFLNLKDDYNSKENEFIKDLNERVKEFPVHIFSETLYLKIRKKEKLLI